MASLLGIPVDTLGTYERGVSEPGMTLLANYRSRFGINLNWLATGEGEMFEPAASRAEPVDGAAMRTIAALVSLVYRESGVAEDPGTAASHSINIYNQLVARGVDLNDDEEVQANLPPIALSLRRKLKQLPGGKQAAPPGKHQA